MGHGMHHRHLDDEMDAAEVGGPGWGGPGWRFRRHFDEDAPWPPFGPFGRRFGPKHERLLERGQLKYVILATLQDQPRHGYDIMRALEEHFHGFYTPSPGSVYPTLQMLEDQGYVTGNEQDGKRTYTLTDEGRQVLSEHRAELDALSERIGGGWGESSRAEIGQLMQEIGQLAQFLARQRGHGAIHDPARIRRVRDVVHRARTEIEAIFSEEDKPSTIV
ncbi:MAG TPA: PadR family transcriptional regulator [Thermomicrobiaceae bacterium]|nr:PadR family transcriptional regulator [Thermomicrobiaceae bacterium]